MRILILFFIPLLLLNGCVIYGEGTTTGYVTTIENGFFWDKVWSRASLETSQTDCLVIGKEQTLIKRELLETSKNKQRIQLNYKRHLIVLATGCYDDEIWGYEKI